jgi:hypothetical protein
MDIIQREYIRGVWAYDAARQSLEAVRDFAESQVRKGGVKKIEEMPFEV